MKDKFALTSAAWIAGSPLLLFGLGAAFAVFAPKDLQLGSGHPGPQEGDNWQRRWRKGMVCPSNAEKDLPFNRQLAAMALLSLDHATGKPSKKGSKRRLEQSTLLNQMRGSRFQFFSSRWLTADKLIKQKQHLINQVEKVNKGNKLSLVSNLLTQIERLDKALKRLGC